MASSNDPKENVAWHKPVFFHNLRYIYQNFTSIVGAYPSFTTISASLTSTNKGSFSGVSTEVKILIKLNIPQDEIPHAQGVQAYFLSVECHYHDYGSKDP